MPDLRTPRQKARDGFLYHVSPSKNRESIRLHDLEPSLFSQGKHRKLWLVEWKEVMWAINHVAQRHGVALENLDVWIIRRNNIRNLQKTGLRDVYQTPCRVGTGSYMRAEDAIRRYEEFLGDVTRTPGGKIS